MRVKLDDVCTKGASNLKQKDITGLDGNYPIYGAPGLIGRAVFYHQDKKYIAVVKDGAGIGRTMLLPEKSSVIGTLQYLIPKDNVLPEYLYYVVCHMHLEKYFSGATIPHIYFRDYKNEEFNLDSIEVQKKIITVLDSVSNIIDSRKKQLSELDDLIKARFVEMFGDPELNPYGWKYSPLSALVTVKPQNGLYKPQSDYVQDSSGIPILRIDAFYNGKVTDFRSLRRLICTDVERKRYLLRENDIVINRVNSIEYLGKCAHIKGMKEDTVFESNMMRFHLDESVIDAAFAVHLLCTQYIYKQIINRAKKAVNQASINQGDVMSFQMLVPPIVLQKQFVSFVTQVDKSKFCYVNGWKESPFCCTI